MGTRRVEMLVQVTLVGKVIITHDDLQARVEVVEPAVMPVCTYRTEDVPPEDRADLMKLAATQLVRTANRNMAEDLKELGEYSTSDKGEVVKA